jgi:hypothetical protein
MASQSVVSTTQPLQAPNLANWRAYHVFYHADLNLLVREFAHRLAAELLRQGLIDRFYFVRYGLGGPHLRIRWRLTGQADEPQERILAGRCAEFFAMHPSLKPLPPEQILKVNEGIAKGDAYAGSEISRIYDDNSWRAFPPQIEVERYGGEEHIDASLDVFCLSSISVFHLFGRQEAPHKSWASSAMMRLALQLALGFASGEAEFVRLLGYALEPWGRLFPSCLNAADRAFESQAGKITDFVLSELEAITTQKRDDSILFAGARALASRVSSLSAERRWRVSSSHIHMTANRLGILNPEEAYLSRMLVRAAESIRLYYPAAWKLFWHFSERLYSQEELRTIDATYYAAVQSRLLAEAVV